MGTSRASSNGSISADRVRAAPIAATHTRYRFNLRTKTGTAVGAKALTAVPSRTSSV